MKTVQETPDFKINKKTIVIRDYVDLTPEHALHDMRIDLLALDIDNCAYTECIKTDEVNEEGQVSTMLCFFFNDDKLVVRGYEDVMTDIYNKYASSQTKRVIEQEPMIEVMEEDPILEDVFDEPVKVKTPPVEVKLSSASKAVID